MFGDPEAIDEEPSRPPRWGSESQRSVSGSTGRAVPKDFRPQHPPEAAPCGRFLPSVAPPGPQASLHNRPHVFPGGRLSLTKPPGIPAFEGLARPSRARRGPRTRPQTAKTAPDDPNRLPDGPPRPPDDSRRAPDTRRCPGRAPGGLGRGSRRTGTAVRRRPRTRTGRREHAKGRFARPELPSIRAASAEGLLSIGRSRPARDAASGAPAGGRPHTELPPRPAAPDGPHPPPRGEISVQSQLTHTCGHETTASWSRPIPTSLSVLCESTRRATSDQSRSRMTV